MGFDEDSASAIWASQDGTSENHSSSSHASQHTQTQRRTLRIRRGVYREGATTAVLPCVACDYDTGARLKPIDT